MRLRTIGHLVAGLAFLTGIASAAEVPHYNQSRFPWENFHEARDRHAPRLLGTDPTAPANLDRAWSDLDLSSIPEWPSEELLREAFIRVRDERFILQFSHEITLPFARRISWLFPDDGCYARSALANQKLEEWGYQRPKKLFIFGRLKFDTPNEQSGRVYWWYHAVPVVSVKGKVFVFDPAMEPKSPLLLQDWIGRMHVTEANSTAALCSPFTYHPWRPCFSAGPSDESGAALDIIPYLEEEWRRLEVMGRQPQIELGDNPPWAAGSL